MAADTQTTTTTLLSYDSFSGSNDRGDYTIHKFSSNDERLFQTRKDDVAAVAKSLLGKPVEVTFTARTRGEWTNYWIDSVKPAAQAALNLDSEKMAIVTGLQGTGKPFRTLKDVEIARENCNGIAKDITLALYQGGELAITSKDDLLAVLFGIAADLEQSVIEGYQSVSALPSAEADSAGAGEPSFASAPAAS